MCKGCLLFKSAERAHGFAAGPVRRKCEAELDLLGNQKSHLKALIGTLGPADRVAAA
jgi:hypothetical protein